MVASLCGIARRENGSSLRFPSMFPASSRRSRLFASLVRESAMGPARWWRGRAARGRASDDSDTLRSPLTRARRAAASPRRSFGSPFLTPRGYLLTVHPLDYSPRTPPNRQGSAPQSFKIPTLPGRVAYVNAKKRREISIRRFVWRTVCWRGPRPRSSTRLLSPPEDHA